VAAQPVGFSILQTRTDERHRRKRAKPCARVECVFARMPDREAWWQAAREEPKRYTLLSGVPQSRPREDRERMFEHLYEFVSMLLAAIIPSSEAECTYFREQLAWFHAGYFPCGWEGHWPDGRMHVFAYSARRSAAPSAFRSCKHEPTIGTPIWTPPPPS
jgi:hypothetical protein